MDQHHHIPVRHEFFPSLLPRHNTEGLPPVLHLATHQLLKFGTRLVYFGTRHIHIVCISCTHIHKTDALCMCFCFNTGLPFCCLSSTFPQCIPAVHSRSTFLWSANFLQKQIIPGSGYAYLTLLF